MKKITTRQVFFMQLKKKLQFKYNKEEISGVLSDYAEFFDIEMSQGKSEREVCSLLGNPVDIVQSLGGEMQTNHPFPINIFSKEVILRSIFAAIFCFILSYIVYKSDKAYDAAMLTDLLIILPVLAMFLWMSLKKYGYTFTKTISLRNTIGKVGAVHLICFFMLLFLFVFLNDMVTEKEKLIFNLKQEQIGNFMTGILYLSLAIFFSIIIFGIFNFQKDPFSYFSVICHGLGAFVITLYHINVLHSLSDSATYSRNIMKCGFLYLESLAMIMLLYILFHKRRYVSGCSTEKGNS